MGQEWNYQKQIDRACSAQSNDMMPKRESWKKIAAADSRIEEAQD